MTEILFVLVTVYAVYVIHSVINSNQIKKTKAVDPKPSPPVEKPSKKEEKPVAKTKPEVKKVAPAKKVASKKTTVAKKTAPAKKVALAEGRLRNPETGDVDKIANSYRMLRRWIKEALVEEKLLDKIYKSNELDDASKEKINAALVKLQKIKKYQ
jgi:hypothetical protein